MSAELIAAARAWLAQDPDETTRDELEALLARVEGGDAAALAALQTAFAGPLEFGTAGLRGPIGFGNASMNRVSVGQAAAGLARFLVSREAHPSIVIGYDGRTNSDVFARDTAEIMAGAGVRAILLPTLAPTPVTAFAVRHLGVSAGVMVTASHNPPRDNGFKVYLGGQDGGSQIVSPVDAEIAAEIARVAAEQTFAELPKGEYALAGDDVFDAYVAATAELGGTPAADAPVIVYTAMHGVGTKTVEAVMARAGYAPLIGVPEQAEPDAAFPTVDFPNPEEPGALDLAKRTAREHSADLIVANDPDADRLAICVPDADAEGGYRQLTGNEVGLLFGWDAARASGGVGVLASSLVSSPGLAMIAAAYGLEYRATLTGFKWVSRVPHLVYGYEEALGYLVNPETVRDKDGVSALLSVVRIANELAARGSNLDEELIAMAAEFGAYASGQVSLRVTDLSRIGALMTQLRADPPAEFAGVAVTAADDLATPEHGEQGNILRYSLIDGSRIMVRPSGTEPKLKVYIDALAAEGAPAERIQAAREAVDRYAEAVRALLA